MIAVLTICLVVFFTAVGVLLAVFWYVKKTRLANTSRVGTVSLQNTQFQGAEIPHWQQNTQPSDPNNPTAFRNQLQHVNYKNVAHSSNNLINKPQRFQMTQGTPNQQSIVSQNRTKTYPLQENENRIFYLNPAQNYDDQEQQLQHDNQSRRAPEHAHDTHTIELSK